MKRTNVVALAVAGTALALGALGLMRASGAGVDDATSVLLSVDPRRSPRLMPTPAAIERFEERVVTRPESADNHYVLAGLYARQQRETGDESRLGEIERLLHRAVELRPDYVEARVALAGAMNRQHRFREGLLRAEEILAEDDGRLDALSVIADAHLGLGHYGHAGGAVDRLLAEAASPAVLARAAQLAELNGEPDRALEIMARAAQAALDAYLPRSEMAWYWFRLGDLHARAGRHRLAGEFADRALASSPGYPAGLLLRATAEAGQGRWDAAAAAIERVAKTMPHPEILGRLGDLEYVRGNRAAAKARWQQAIASGAEGGEAEDRPMARFLADHDLLPAEALMRAERDLARRRDLTAWDTFAWALYRNGRYEEAAEAAARALATGVRDASFHYHAGLIQLALGHAQAARQHLRTALEINPKFDVLLADDAAERLASLGG